MLATLATFVVVIVTHELGHVVAARAFGHRVFAVNLGIGPAITRHIGGVDWHFAPIPFGGSVQSGSPDLAHARRDGVVIALAGSIANGVLAIGAGLVGATAVMALAAVMGAINLVPTRPRRFGTTASDGRVVLDLLRDAPVVDEDRSAWWAASAMRARDDGDLDGAARFVAEGLDLVGSTASLHSVGGLVEYEAGRYGGAADHFAHLVDHPHVSVRLRGAAAGSAAWAAFHSGEARFDSAIGPWARFALGTSRRPGERQHAIAAIGDILDGDPATALGRLPAAEGEAALVTVAWALAELGEPSAARSISARRGGDLPPAFAARLAPFLDPGGDVGSGIADGGNAGH